MNLQELRDYVTRQLGAPTVIVELTPEQIDGCIDQALGRFNRFLCRPDGRLLKNQTGTVVVAMQPTDRGVIGVKHLPPDDSRTYANMSVFELMYRMVFPRMPVSEWYMLKAFYETYQSVRGTDCDWSVDPATNTLFIDCCSGPYDIYYVVSCDFTAETIDRLAHGKLQDFKDLVLAESKLVLGRVRGKFGNSIPVPSGTLTTDASELKEEGTKKIEEIEVRLKAQARFSTSPIMWF